MSRSNGGSENLDWPRYRAGITSPKPIRDWPPWQPQLWSGEMSLVSASNAYSVPCMPSRRRRTAIPRSRLSLPRPSTSPTDQPPVFLSCWSGGEVPCAHPVPFRASRPAGESRTGLPRRCITRKVESIQLVIGTKRNRSTVRAVPLGSSQLPSREKIRHDGVARLERPGGTTGWQSRSPGSAAWPSTEARAQVRLRVRRGSRWMSSSRKVSRELSGFKEWL